MSVEFQQILNKELSKRVKKNPGYSLRAFAKYLEVSPSALSAMMAGKRPITKKSIQLLGLRLGLSVKKIDDIILGVNFKLTSVNKRPLQFREIEEEQLSVLSDWYNLTILELMKLEDFEPTEKYVAKKLGITVFEARNAINCLQRAGILEISKGVWKDRFNGFSQSLPKEKTTAIRRRLQEQYFKKALAAITEVDFEQRDHTGMTMAIAAEDIPLARTLITKFRRELSQLLENRGKPNQVYQLSVGFFPLTIENKKESKE